MNDKVKIQNTQLAKSYNHFAKKESHEYTKFKSPKDLKVTNFAWTD